MSLSLNSKRKQYFSTAHHFQIKVPFESTKIRNEENATRTKKRFKRLLKEDWNLSYLDLSYDFEGVCIVDSLCSYLYVSGIEVKSIGITTHIHKYFMWTARTFFHEYFRGTGSQTDKYYFWHFISYYRCKYPFPLKRF